MATQEKENNGLSETMRAKWRDPEYREKQLADRARRRAVARGEAPPPESEQDEEVRTPVPEGVPVYVGSETAARILGVTRRWLKDARAEGVIPFHKFGTQVRFAVHDLEEYARRNRIEPEGW